MRAQPRFEPGTDIAEYIPLDNLQGVQQAAQQMVPQDAFIAVRRPAAEEMKMPDPNMHNYNANIAENLQRMQQVIANGNAPVAQYDEVDLQLEFDDQSHPALPDDNLTSRNEGPGDDESEGPEDRQLINLDAITMHGQ